VLARSLGPAEFARFALLTFVVPLAAWASTDAGFEQAATREASRAFSAGDLRATRELLGKTLGWNLLRLPLTAALTLAIVQPGPALAAVLVATLAIVFGASGLNLALSAENRGAARARLALVASLIGAAASVASALAGASAETIWVLAFASSAVSAPVLAFIANPGLRRAAVTPRLPRGLPRGFWRYAATALALSAGGTLVFNRSEVVVLELLDQHQALAVFALAAGLAQRLTMPLDTVLGPLIPALAALDAVRPERVREGLERALRLSAAGVAFVAAVGLVAAALAAPFIFGPGYEGVGAAFAVLAVISLVRSAAQPYTALAYALGRPGVVLVAYSVAVVVDGALAFSLIPVLGLWGAVAANGAAAVAALALVARATAGRGSVRRSGIPAARLLGLAAGACALALAAGVPAAVVHPLVGAGAALLMGTVAFLAGARLGGGLVSGPDADALAGALPRRGAVRLALSLVRSG